MLANSGLERPKTRASCNKDTSNTGKIGPRQHCTPYAARAQQGITFRELGPRRGRRHREGAAVSEGAAIKPAQRRGRRTRKGSRQSYDAPPPPLHGSRRCARPLRGRTKARPRPVATTDIILGKPTGFRTVHAVRWSHETAREAAARFVKKYRTTKRRHERVARALQEGNPIAYRENRLVKNEECEERVAEELKPGIDVEDGVASFISSQVRERDAAGRARSSPSRLPYGGPGFLHVGSSCLAPGATRGWSAPRRRLVNGVARSSSKIHQSGRLGASGS